MKFPGKIWVGLSLIAASALTVEACSKQGSYRDTVAQQNAIQTQQKDRELDSVAGVYAGTMHINSSDEDLDVLFTLTRSDDNTHSSQSSDPTDTIQLPKLVGSMRFPALKNAGPSALDAFPDVVQAMGDAGALSFSYGDYSVSTQTIYLPFAVNSHPSGSFGTVTGSISGGHFTGTWLSNSGDTFGSFDVTPVKAAQSSGGNS